MSVREEPPRMKLAEALSILVESHVRDEVDRDGNVLQTIQMGAIPPSWFMEYRKERGGSLYVLAWMTVWRAVHDSRASSLQPPVSSAH